MRKRLFREENGPKHDGHLQSSIDIKGLDRDRRTARPTRPQNEDQEVSPFSCTHAFDAEDTLANFEATTEGRECHDRHLIKRLLQRQRRNDSLL